MFKAQHLIFGAAAAKGVGKTGNPYDYGILLQPVPITTWKNEKGEGKASGYKTPEKSHDALTCTAEMLSLLDKVELPAYLEMDLVPHEDDIKTLVCVSFKVLAYLPTKYEQFQILYSPNSPVDTPKASTAPRMMEKPNA